MKIKELEKTVNLAWSPKSQFPILIAAGTAAQLDASFDTSAALELYSLNLGDSSLDLDLLCSSPSERRFHSLAWEAYESDKSVIVGGCDDGRLVFYDAVKLLRNENGSVDCKKNHTGAVRALDFNPFQKHLLASGASESQLIIWDLSKLNQPFPLIDSSQSQPSDDIISVSWNKQVQHILAATFSSKCVVWDLKKNKPIMKLADSVNRIRWKDVAWNPQVATQLCLASEDDQYPIIQLWDLRFATGPIRTLQGHQKGVLSVAWCDEDPELLVSCGKDNKLVVWNLRTDAMNSDVLCEMPLSSQWNFEVKWCPRNPFLVSISSAVDRRASVYSLCGGQPVGQTSNKIADSFPGMNNYPQSLPLEQLHPQQQPIVELRRPPKWMKKPVGVSFAFGGKLVSFNGNENIVYVSQVVTEPELMYRFKELLDALEQNNIFDHCYKKAELANDSQAKEVWNMIATQFYGEAFQNQACLLLGTTEVSLYEKLRVLNIKDDTVKKELTENDSCPDVSRIGPADGDDIFDSLANNQENLSLGSSQNFQNGFQNLKKPLKIVPGNDLESAICDALLLGNKEMAVNLCIKEGRMADALVLASTGGPELIMKTQIKYFEKTDNYLTTLISAVVNEDWCNIVETCDLSNWKQVLVALINHTKGDEFRALCELLGQRLLLESESSLKKNALICFVCAGNVNQLLDNWSIINPNVVVDIQELVDVGLVMKEAMKLRGINISICGCLAKVLVQYAELLASQGYLTAAYTYLSETSEEENVKMLRDRLACVLGMPTSDHNRREVQPVKSINNFPPSSLPTQHPSYQVPFGNAPLSNFSHTNNASKLTSKPPINEVPPLSAVTDKPQLFTTRKLNSQSVPPSPSVDSGGHQFSNLSVNQPASSYSASTNSFQPHSGLQQGPMPPPSAPKARIQFFDPAINGQFNHYTKPETSPTVSPPSITPTAVRSTPTPPAPPPSSQVPYNNMRQTPDHITGQSRGKYVVDPSVQGGLVNRGSFSGNFQNYAPVPNTSSVNPVQPFSSYEPSAYHVTPNQQTAYPPTVSNANPYIPDPNVLPPPPHPNISHQMQANVTLGAQANIPNQTISPQSAQQMQILQPTSQMPSQRPRVAQISPSASGWNDPPPLAFEKPISNSVPPQPQPPLASFSAPNSYQSNAVQTGSLRTPEEESIKSKPTLPEPHIHLQTVFEELRNQCVSKTANQQMKRKLEDVARKLEMLYDNIRENKLTARTLAGLHKIINAIQQGNYQASLALYTELVSGPDFATIASFMPGIKVLVQSALQLDVYI